MDSKHCGWAGSIAQFLTVSRDQWLAELEAFHRQCMREAAGTSQVTAWKDEFHRLKQVLGDLVNLDPSANQWNIIFEYELPRERGRRPDVIVLAGNNIVAIEFKRSPIATPAMIDQAAAYARDLEHYHRPSHGHEVRAVLAIGSNEGHFTSKNGVSVVGANALSKYLAAIADASQSAISLADWLAGEYAPLPSLVAAARTIFQNEGLPQIRRADSAGIPEAIAEMNRIAAKAVSERTRHLLLITGVPGAGKTLLGLQYVYHDHLGGGPASQSAVFLSGNGPLVKVLRHALRNQVFVQDVHGFLKQYGGNARQLPHEHIFVYDGAQRAWDAKRVAEKRGHALSEPDDFVSIGDRIPDWCVLVGLIGEGQEIHLGEESGLGQWADAITKSKNSWTVHCPAKLERTFTSAKIEKADCLDLTTSLRSHLAADLHQWVAFVLNSCLPEAASAATSIINAGFDLYMTRDIEAAKAYVSERYEGQLDKRYGLLGSSKAKNLSVYGINTDYSFTRNFREGPWYNDLPASDHSCCQLRETATEFACQGLEVDLPIVGWGDDLWFEDGTWRTRPSPRSTAKDPHRLRLNSYRVLLTRGRDGMILFVPPGPRSEASARALLAAGCRELKKSPTKLGGNASS